MKKHFLIGVISIMLLLLVTPSSAILIKFDPVSQTVPVGDTAVVALVISGLGDLESDSIGVFDLIVEFNPAVLSLSPGSVSYGDPVLGDQLDPLYPFAPLTLPDTIIGANEVNLFELSLVVLPDELDCYQAGAFTLAILSFDTIG